MVDLALFTLRSLFRVLFSQLVFLIVSIFHLYCHFYAWLTLDWLNPKQNQPSGTLVMGVGF